MDIPTLLSAFMVSGGDSVQGPAGGDPAGSGAEFEASLILVEGVVPAPADVLRKIADKAGPAAPVVLGDARTQEVGLDVPVCWQALVCDASEGTEISPKAPLAKDEAEPDEPALADATPHDLALAQAVILPVVLAGNLGPSQSAFGEPAPSAAPNLEATQEVGKASLTPPGSAWPLDQPQGAQVTGQSTLPQPTTLEALPTAQDQKTVQPLAPKPDVLNHNDVLTANNADLIQALPASTKQASTESQAARLSDAVGPSTRSQPKNVDAVNPQHATTAQQAARDAQAARLQGDDLPLELAAAGESLARQEPLSQRSAPTAGQAESRLQSAQFTEGLALRPVSTTFERVNDKGAAQVANDSAGQAQTVSPQSASQASMGQKPSDDSQKLTPGIEFAQVAQGQAAQDPQATAKPSSRKSPTNAAGLTPVSGSGPNAYDLAGRVDKPSTALPHEASVHPSKPVSRAAEAAAKDAISVADKPIASSAAPDAVLPANPQALGGSPPAHLQTPMQPALPPKTAEALHAQLPAVIEHLHHGGAHDGHNRAEVLLNPAELGRIRFELITQGDQVQVSLTVERPETLDLMRAHAETLREEFRAAGLNTDTLNFGQWAQRAPSRDQPEPGSREQVDSVSVQQIIAAPYVKPVSATGLDLRL